MGKHSGSVNIKQVARPKHVEEFSLKEDAQFQPWEVVMLVQPERYDPRLYKTIYYVRAPLGQPGSAAVMANRCWLQWEKIDKGFKFQPYPDTVEQAGVSRMTEEEWSYVWIEAQRYEHNYEGMKENPSVFTFRKPGYGEEDGKRLPLKSSIIMPGMPGFNK